MIVWRVVIRVKGKQEKPRSTGSVFRHNKRRNEYEKPMRREDTVKTALQKQITHEYNFTYIQQYYKFV